MRGVFRVKNFMFRSTRSLNIQTYIFTFHASMLTRLTMMPCCSKLPPGSLGSIFLE